MLYVSFDGRYQFEVACAIDLIKGIMHCLMSFTHGWVVNNHPVISDPELFFTPPPPLIFLIFSLSWCRGPDTHRRGNGNQLRPWFLFFYPVPSQIDSYACFALIIISDKCSVNVQRMSMNIRCQGSLHEISFENYKYYPAANCLAIKANCE